MTAQDCNPGLDRCEGPLENANRTLALWLFDEGLGEHLMLGLDWAFDCEQGPFVASSFMPPPPFRYMFTHTLPRFRKLGLADAAIEQMMVTNPARVLPVQ